MQGWKLDDDSSEEDIDAVPAEMRPYRPTRIDKRRKHVTSYRQEGLGFWAAFFQGKMRGNDYVMLWSVIFMSALIIVYGALSAAYTEKSLGLMFAITLLHVILLAISLMGNIIANRRQDLWERILTVCSFVLIYIAAIVYMIVAYDIGLLSKDKEDLNIEELAERNECENFIAGELVLIPFITAFIAFLGKAWRDNTNGRSMTTGFYIFMALNFIHGIALVVVFFLFLDNKTAIVCLVILSMAFYWFVQYIMRIRYSSRPIKITDKISISPYKQAMIWNWINGILALSVFVATVVYARTDDEISNFASISIILGMIGVILSLLILGTWIADRTQMNE